jgi:type VI secretion system protein ImpM
VIAAGAAAGASVAPSFATGWYGKIPATGDFIARRVPPSFSEAWDRWVQAAMAGSRSRLGERWRDAYLSMPPWRFVVAAGMLTKAGWAGVMVPSVDAVGRHFPLVAAAALPPAGVDVLATLFAANAWLDEVEAVALAAIMPDADGAAIDAALIAKPFRPEWLRAPAAEGDTAPIQGTKPQMLWAPLAARVFAEEAPVRLRHAAQRLAEPWAAWLAEESEVFGRCVLLCEAFPVAEQFCAMLDGRWSEHGWTRREAA